MVFASNQVNDRVYLAGGRVGTIRYIGKTKFSKEKHLGVELDAGFTGENNGSFGGHQHFQCRPGQGLFILPEDVVEKLTGKRAKTVYKTQDRIELMDSVVGTVRYIGTPRYFKGTWYGIELDEKDRGSRQDGRTKDGQILFNCSPGHGRLVQLHEIVTRLDLKDASREKNGRVNQFITLEISDWPLGFMLDSTADKPEVIKVISRNAVRQGLQPGHILEFINGKRVGHLSTEQILDRLTIVDFPLKLKFVEFQNARMGMGRPSIEVGVNQGYVQNRGNQGYLMNTPSPRSISPPSNQSVNEPPIRRTMSDSFQPYDSGEDDTDYDSDKPKPGCIIS